MRCEASGTNSRQFKHKTLTTSSIYFSPIQTLSRNEKKEFDSCLADVYTVLATYSPEKRLRLVNHLSEIINAGMSVENKSNKSVKNLSASIATARTDVESSSNNGTTAERNPATSTSTSTKTSYDINGGKSVVPISLSEQSVQNDINTSSIQTSSANAVDPLNVVGVRQRKMTWKLLL